MQGVFSAQGRQRPRSIKALPMTVTFFSARGSGGMAATGHAWPQALHEYWQKPVRGTMTGVQ
jgi:hypothetical protein